MILITGATGNVGRAVLGQLIAENRDGDRRVRVLSRNPDKVEWPSGVETFAGDLSDPESFRAALSGVEAVHLFPAPGAGPGFVATAEAAGVRRVVLLSSAAVQDGAEVQP